MTSSVSDRNTAAADNARRQALDAQRQAQQQAQVQQPAGVEPGVDADVAAVSEARADVAGAEQAERTRDVVAAATVDNDKARLASEQLATQTKTTTTTPALPAVDAEQQAAQEALGGRTPFVVNSTTPALTAKETTGLLDAQTRSQTATAVAERLMTTQAVQSAFAGPENFAQAEQAFAKMNTADKRKLGVPSTSTSLEAAVMSRTDDTARDRVVEAVRERAGIDARGPDIRQGAISTAAGPVALSLIEQANGDGRTPEARRKELLASPALQGFSDGVTDSVTGVVDSVGFAADMALSPEARAQAAESASKVAAALKTPEGRTAIAEALGDQAQAFIDKGPAYVGGYLAGQVAAGAVTGGATAVAGKAAQQGLKLLNPKVVAAAEKALEKIDRLDVDKATTKLDDAATAATRKADDAATTTTTTTTTTKLDAATTTAADGTVLTDNPTRFFAGKAEAQLRRPLTKAESQDVVNKIAEDRARLGDERGSAVGADPPRKLGDKDIPKEFRTQTTDPAKSEKLAAHHLITSAGRDNVVIGENNVLARLGMPNGGDVKRVDMLRADKDGLVPVEVKNQKEADVTHAIDKFREIESKSAVANDVKHYELVIGEQSKLPEGYRVDDSGRLYSGAGTDWKPADVDNGAGQRKPVIVRRAFLGPLGT